MNEFPATHNQRINAPLPSVAVVHFVTRSSDGISLQIHENGKALWEKGISVLECSADAKGNGAFTIPELDFNRTSVKDLKKRIFTAQGKDDVEEAELNNQLDRQSWEIKERLEEFVALHQPSLLHVRNILSLPIHPGATIAFSEFIQEHPEINFVLQHHDMVTDVRKKAYMTPYPSLHNRIFGSLFPKADNVRHAVINSPDKLLLKATYDIDSEIVYDSFDFNTVPETAAGSLRQQYGISENDFLLLHPGRIIPRKRIEDAVDYGADYVAAIKDRLEESEENTVTMGDRTYTTTSRCTLLLPQARDKDAAYYTRLLAHAQMRGVTLAYIGDDVITDSMFFMEDKLAGKIPFFSLYTNDEIDRVIVPSEKEGFGNNLLEAMALGILRERKKLVVVHKYPVFETDIEPILPDHGVISLGSNQDYNVLADGYELPETVRREAVAQTIWWEQHPDAENQKAEEVYKAVRDNFDSKVITDSLVTLFGFLNNNRKKLVA